VDKKQVLILLGSPRKKGNSAILAQRIAAGAEAAGAEVETVYINGLKISPCQSCYACQKPDSEGCAVDDDMQPLYGKLKAADAWVWASPVYWFNMSAQTKLVMDRLFAMGAYKINPAKKKGAVAMSFGDIDPFASGCVNALRVFQDACRYIGLPLAGMIYGSAHEAGEIAANAELMSRAEELGKKLAG
jgi:multimeric flavodoxin WrbA